MKKIVLVGKGASGKNFLMERFEKRGFRHLVSHTTRPMRVGEKEGDEYHFVSRDEFEKMIADDELLEYQEFGGELYGCSKKEWENSDVVIMAPQGVENLKNLNLRDECFVIYVDIPYHERRRRLCSREGESRDSIESRLLNDEDMFKDFEDYDLIIKNTDF